MPGNGGGDCGRDRADGCAVKGEKMRKYREPTEKELNAEITRLEGILRAYKMDEMSKAWTEREIKRLRGEIAKIEEKKEETQKARKKRAKRA